MEILGGNQKNLLRKRIRLCKRTAGQPKVPFTDIWDHIQESQKLDQTKIWIKRKPWFQQQNVNLISDLRQSVKASENGRWHVITLQTEIIQASVQAALITPQTSQTNPLLHHLHPDHKSSFSLLTKHHAKCWQAC